MGEAPGGLRFSHIGLYVIDMTRMVDFYSRVLGFAVTDRGKLGDTGLTFLSRDPGDHHQIVLVDGRPPGLPDRIVNQVSFRLATLGELIAFYRRIRAEEAPELVSYWFLSLSSSRSNRFARSRPAPPPPPPPPPPLLICT